MPVAAPALADLLWIGLLLFSFAFVWTARKLIEALFGALISLLEQVPVIGKYVGHLLFTIEQAVANALGTAEGAIDTAIGASWHFLARLCSELWHEIVSHGALLLEIATGIYPIVVAIRALKALLHHVTSTGTVSAARVKTLEREYHGIEHQVKVLERELRGIDETGIKAKLGTLEREIATVEGQTIPAIQQQESDAWTAIGNLYDWIKGKASVVGVGTFATAVGAVLSAVGLDWLACRSRTGVNGKSGCNLWNDIESLLGLAIVSGLALDLPALIAEAQSVTPGIIEGIEQLAGLRQ